MDFFKTYQSRSFFHKLQKPERSAHFPYFIHKNAIRIWIHSNQGRVTKIVNEK